ncbi:MAG: hypothetical protein Q9177_003442 [Variospora cf. flavescens]
MTLATLPYMRAMYNGLRKKLFDNLEKKWARQIQPRGGEDGGNADNDGGQDQALADDGQGGIMNFELGVELEIIEEEEVPAVPEQQHDVVDQAPIGIAGIGDLAQEPAPGADQEGNRGDALDPNPLQQENHGQGPAGAPNHDAPVAQNQNPGLPAEQHRVVRLVPLVSAVVHTMMGALAFPAVAAGMGDLILLFLPYAWRVPPHWRERRSRGLLQSRSSSLQSQTCVDERDGVPSDIPDLVPPNCKITFAQILSRHGARHPTSSKTKIYGSTIQKLQDNVQQFSGKYSFLNNFTSSLDADQLTVFGERQMIHSGIAFYSRYKNLAKQGIPFIRASGEARVVKSAQNFSQGFHDAKSTAQKADIDYPYPILEIPEGDGYNNTCVIVAPPETFEESQPYHSIGSRAQQTFLETFLPAVTDRLNADLAPANLSASDTVNIMDLCPFTTAASPIGAISSFCDLFTDDEWHHYDYYQTLGKYYGYGPGNPLGPSQGVGFANELVARMTERPVDDHTSVNHTLDYNAITFPLNQALYVDVSHDNDMTAIFSAMGLYNGTRALCNTSIETTWQTRGYSAAWTVPFAGRAYFEKMECRGEKEELVRIIVNDRVLPLETCGGDALGRCTLSKFVGSLSFAAGGGKWDMCFTGYDHANIRTY